jgi:diguanylate cyclase (GGDEF)-like protein
MTWPWLLLALLAGGAGAGWSGHRAFTRLRERHLSLARRYEESVAEHAKVERSNSRLIERLHHEARHDELTGLPNRLSFRGLLDAAAREARAGTPSAVMLLDFNGFKAINDSLGHPAGDELLRVMAGRFQVAVGSDAVVARLGGDEFAVLARGCPDPEAAVVLARRVLGAFDEAVPLAGARLRIGGALGIALGPEHGTTGADLLRKADVAMYVAKARAAGAAAWRMYDPDMTITSPADLSLATDLRDAIAADRIAVAVQPLVDLRTGAVHSFEALARWRHAELGEIRPEEFFAAAERSGQVPALSERVLDHALRAGAGWRRQGLDLRVTVNVAPRWLAEATLPDQVAAALDRHGVRPDRLGLELTEDGVTAGPQGTRDVLARLRSMGVHLALDDFGTGYSSLTFLSRLPVDQLKIDRSFVRAVTRSDRDRAIVRSVVDLGRNLGLEVVAEGLADAGARRTLQGMGCLLGQGYLFTRPVPPAAVAALVNRVGFVGWGGVRPAQLPVDQPAARPPARALAR